MAALTRVKDQNTMKCLLTLMQNMSVQKYHRDILNEENLIEKLLVYFRPLPIHGCFIESVNLSLIVQILKQYLQDEKSKGVIEKNIQLLLNFVYLAETSLNAEEMKTTQVTQQQKVFYEYYEDILFKIEVLSLLLQISNANRGSQLFTQIMAYLKDYCVLLVVNQVEDSLLQVSLNLILLFLRSEPSLKGELE